MSNSDNGTIPLSLLWGYFFSFVLPSSSLFCATIAIGVASLVDNFEVPEEYEKEYKIISAQPEYETPARARLRRARERRERVERIIEEKKKEYDPQAYKDEVTEDPYKTIFVSKLVSPSEVVTMTELDGLFTGNYYDIIAFSCFDPSQR